MKTCTKCKEKKEFKEFNKDSSKKDGFYSSCNLCRNKNSKKYYIKNKEKINKNVKQYHINNPEYNKIYSRKRRENPNIVLQDNLRTRLRSALNCNQKKGSAVRDLGCSIEELKKHLEKKFTKEMNWDNRGKIWHLDHIYPISKVDLTDRRQLLLVVNYKNLQPLLCSDNIKKSDKIDKSYKYVNYVLNKLKEFKN